MREPVNLFKGLSSENRSSGGQRHARLVGDHKTGRYAYGDYDFVCTGLVQTQTNDKDPLILIEGEIVDVLTKRDVNQQPIPADLDPSEYREKGIVPAAYHEKGAKVSEGFVINMNRFGEPTVQGARNRDRMLAAIEALLGEPTGSLADEETANAVVGALLEDPDTIIGSRAIIRVSSRKTFNKDTKKEGTWTQPYWNIAK